MAGQGYSFARSSYLLPLLLKGPSGPASITLKGTLNGSIIGDGASEDEIKGYINNMWYDATLLNADLVTLGSFSATTYYSLYGGSVRKTILNSWDDGYEEMRSDMRVGGLVDIPWT